jgi:hypothetical protein
VAFNNELLAIKTMASKEQYEYFKDMFADEIERKNSLMRKTQLYFSVITVVASIVFTNLFKLKDLIAADVSLKITLSILFCVLFLLLVFIICSVRLQGYSAAIDIESYLNQLPTTDEEQSNNDFFDYRIAEFIAAIQLNQVTNSKKAAFMKLSEYGMICFLFMLLIINLQIIL